MTRPQALVTGASRGIGAAIAQGLAPTHDVFLGGRDSRALRQRVAELPGCTAWNVDLCDLDNLTAAIADIDRLDVLVHNAATAKSGALSGIESTAWQEIFTVNLFAVAELTRLLLPKLRAANGHVVFINAGSGLKNTANRGPYAASKVALRSYAETLQTEEPALRVTSIHPGPTDTDLQRMASKSQGRDHRPDQFLRADSVASAALAAVHAPTDTTISSVVIDRRTP